MTVDATVKQVEELTPDQRAELLDRLHELYGEPDPDEPVELSDEMKALLDERNAAYEANPTDLRTWEQVMGSLRRTP
jgi:putative addiction module component (TIGR02574 family)